MNAPFAPCDRAVRHVDLHDPGEAARIEAFVYAMNGTPFHLPRWLLAVERGTGQRAGGLLAERGGSIAGWLPLAEVRSPFFPAALVSSGFAVGGGPLAENDAIAERLCRAAQNHAMRRACASVELRGDAAPADWRRTRGGHCGFVRDLAEDDEAQLLAIPRKQRAEVRKSLSGDLRVTVGTAPGDRAAHYACYAESVRNLGTPVFPRGLFDAMLDAFGEEADILTVWAGDRPVSSVLTFYHMGAAMPYWGGGVWDARRLRSNERMYFELMCHARRKGCLRFDFGRSKTGSGPYSYKKNWGFEPAPLTYASWSPPGTAPRDIDPTSDAVQGKVALWKKLPLPIANRLGPIIARGLA